VNLRSEVRAAHLDRTMLEVTHCCGTLQYDLDGYADGSFEYGPLTELSGETGDQMWNYHPEVRTCAEIKVSRPPHFEALLRQRLLDARRGETVRVRLGQELAKSYSGGTQFSR